MPIVVQKQNKIVAAGHLQRDEETQSGRGLSRAEIGNGK